VATHVTEYGADSGQNRGQDGKPGGKGIATMLGDMLDFVIVWTVDMETVAGHGFFS
jgi:hypothetical protein